MLLLFGLLPPNRGVAKQTWEYRKELNAIHQILKGNPNLLWHILLGFGWVSYCGFASLTTWSKILWKCLSWLSGQLLWTRFNNLKTRLVQYLDDYIWKKGRDLDMLKNVIQIKSLSLVGCGWFLPKKSTSVGVRELLYHCLFLTVRTILRIGVILQT